MDPQRIAPRRRILKAGSIESGGGLIDCIVRNLSETGGSTRSCEPAFYSRPIHADCSDRSTEAALSHCLAQTKTHRHRVRL